MALQVEESQDDVHTLGSQYVYISEIFNYLLVETCSLHITLCNKNSCADVQISITIRIQALRDVFIQIRSESS